ncbi:MAG: type II secretion system protein GspM [Burkholderiales bacterium]|nr:type II secretion system protein GspM [Burkholderiales bacterium]
MRARLRKAWESRAPRDRMIIAALGIVLGVAFYAWLVQSAGKARVQLGTGVTTLRAQAARLEQQAAELERLRAAPAIAVSQTDLRTLVQTQAGAAGLSRALVKIDAPDANQVVVVFGAVAFADWLNWIAGLKSQQVRLDACRIEALSTPGLVSVTATLVRAQSQ